MRTAVVAMFLASAIASAIASANAAEPAADGTGGDASPSTPAPATAGCTDCGVVISVGTGSGSAVPSWKSTLDGGAHSPAWRPNAIGVPASSRSSIVGRAGDLRLGRSGFVVLVRMEDGTIRTIRAATRPLLAPGDRVRVSGNSILPR